MIPNSLRFFIHCFSIIIIIFTSCGNVNNKTSKTYYEDGSLKTELINKGQDTIINLSYFKNGVVKKSQVYVGNVLDGVSKEYYENGKFKRVGRFKHDKKIGTWSEYSEYGIPMKEYYFVNGEERLYKRYLRAENSNKEGAIEYYYVNNMKAELMGTNYYQFTNVDEYIYNEEISTFYDISVKLLEEPNKVGVKFTFNSKLDSIKIILGEIDDQLNLLSIVDSANVDANPFIFKLNVSSHKYNTIQGLITAKYWNNEGRYMKVAYPIYKDIYIVD